MPDLDPLLDPDSVNPDPQHWIKDPTAKSRTGTFRQFIDFARVLAGEPKGVVCEFVL